MSEAVLNILIQAKDMASAAMKTIKGNIDRLKAASSALATQGFGAVKNAGENMANMMITGLVGGLGAATTAFGLFVKNTMGMEQTRAGFEGMIGNIQKTDELMKQLVETAKKTPLQFTDVAKNAENLLAFGVASDEVNGKIKMLGDVARGNSVKLGLLTNVYGQVKSAGKLMGQDLLQFTSQGIPLIDGLAKHFGVATSEVKKLVENGKVGFADVDAVLQDLTAEGGIFYKSMEKQSKTLAGTVSNLTDNFFAFGRSFLGMDAYGNIKEGGIFSYLVKGANMLLDYMNQIDGAKVADQLMGWVKPAWEFITSKTPEAQSVLAGIGAAVGGWIAAGFATLAIWVIAATWPFVLLALAVGGLFYLFQTNTA
ncbi:MAG: tape measure protein, partial [Flammeovirgaceae bacterium]